jgi:WD40 repeat protein
LALSPDGKSLALATSGLAGCGPDGTDNDSRVWHEDGGWSLATGEAEWHGSLAYSRNGQLIAAGYVDAEIGEHSVAVRHTSDGELVGRWTTDGEAVLAVAFAGADRVRAITSAPLRWSAWEWQRDTGDAVALWHRDGTLTAAAYSPDGLRVAVATDGRVAMCDAETGVELWSVAAGRVDRLYFAPDGRWLAAGSELAVRVYDAGTGAALPGTVRAVAFAPDGYWAILPDGSVHLHDFTGAAVRDLDPLRATEAGLGVSGMRLLHPDDLDA